MLLCHRQCWSVEYSEVRWAISLIFWLWSVFSKISGHWNLIFVIKLRLCQVESGTVVSLNSFLSRSLGSSSERKLRFAQVWVLLLNEFDYIRWLHFPLCLYKPSGPAAEKHPHGTMLPTPRCFLNRKYLFSHKSVLNPPLRPSISCHASCVRRYFS